VSARRLRGLDVRGLGLLGLIATSLVALEGSGEAPHFSVDAAAAQAAGRSGSAALRVGSSPYGRMLFDGRRRALYLFTGDRSRFSRCYGDCARAWPPFLTRGRPRAGRGVRASLIGTVRRRDGRRQVTYRGRPLYFYVGDRRAGQVSCQNVVGFGGTWLVVAPSGRAIR
jgi:predicted lipoprotein with Yx(FWY)xxD motif